MTQNGMDSSYTIPNLAPPLNTGTHDIVSSPTALVEVLNTAFQQLQTGNIAFGLGDLFEYLAVLRDDDPEAWPQCVRTCLGHPIRSLLHQDPFTYRAFSKPRGYAGDAVMMDLIYGLGETQEAVRLATPLGRGILRYLNTRPSAAAVRFRRYILGNLIDGVAARGGTRVLALAAGHLREVAFSRAVQTGTLTDIVAFDQDEASLTIVVREYGRMGVRTMPGSVSQILLGKVNPGKFDFVYAAGLFDYLNTPVATALARRMFEMTRPGGLMLIPNFLTGGPDSGYMEAFMDWYLIYRSHADMQTLAASLTGNAIAEYEIFDDYDAAIAFLLVSKAN